ncbi:MAG: helix-turn-helix domain-containing protein [Oscillospiraceae bacterium]|nr:helix-turn-helix domain-containing protein [Oscillospiraceae bacterium]
MKNYNLFIKPTMLTVKETAEEFQISQYYARQLALSGTVKAVRIGKGKILINAESVAEYFSNAYITTSPVDHREEFPVNIQMER